MMIFGGSLWPRQVSKVVDCQIVSAGELRFDFTHGACHVSTRGNFESNALLCFPFGKEKKCAQYDIFTTEVGFLADSHFDHARTRLVDFGGQWIGDELLETKILSVGSYSGHSKAEIFYNNSWFEVDEFPFSPRLVKNTLPLKINTIKHFNVCHRNA